MCNKSSWTLNLFCTVYMLLHQWTCLITLQRYWGIMTSHYLLFLSLIFPLPSTITQSSFCNDGVFFDKNETRTNSGATEAGCIAEHIYTRTANSSVNDIGNGVATNLRPWHGQNTMHPRHPLKNVRRFMMLWLYWYLLSKKRLWNRFMEF